MCVFAKEVPMATIREVAKEAGVSIAAVSRILNMDETLSVSNETRRRVFQAADQLKYVKKSTKNSGAAEEKRPLIGIINKLDFDRELEDVYFMTVRLAIEERLTESGYRIININPNSHSDIGDDKKMEGCVVIGRLDDDEVDEALQLCDKMVIIDNRFLRNDVDYIGVDLSMAIENVMDYLYENGHRKIAIIADKTPEDLDKEREKLDARIRGYISYMHEKGIYDEELFVKVPYFSNIHAYNSLAEKLKDGVVPTAVISCNDSMANGAYKAIIESGYKIGEEISVVGFNDQSSAEYMIPSLSTVRLPMKNIGYEAVKLITERLKDERDYSKVVLLKTELVIRDSSGKCKA